MRGGRGLIVNIFLCWDFLEWGCDTSGGLKNFRGGVRNFREGWEIFGGGGGENFVLVGGWEIFCGGVKKFSWGGLRNFWAKGLRIFIYLFINNIYKSHHSQLNVLWSAI